MIEESRMLDDMISRRRDRRLAAQVKRQDTVRMACVGAARIGD